jgi:hypothetical protein
VATTIEPTRAVGRSVTRWETARADRATGCLAGRLAVSASNAMGRLSRHYHLPSAVRRSPLRIEAATAHELVSGGALLVDVRRHEDPTASLEQALRVPPDEMPALVGRLARDTPIVLACT